jgi:phosphoribosylaminoimidazolecarboxamide formyltransferase/IMP cyclohydrolase
MPRALLSVYDKTGLIDFARALIALGWELIASGGTAHALTDAGIAVTSVERVTRHAEMLDGRVKTLHPAIHAGILARDTDADMDALREHGYAPIGLVVSNLYPFQQTVARPGVTLDEAIEQIDIGGVALLRAAAKNVARVVTVCDPTDYIDVVNQLIATGSVNEATRRRLAVKAFAHTRDYDTAISAYLSAQFALADTSTEFTSTDLPETLAFGLRRVETLRYGENPHQQAALYAEGATLGPLGGEILGGKALSYNNMLDLDSAWRTLASFNAPTVVIVKHLTPCGIASAEAIVDAFPAALACDPVSAYGGVMAVNQVVELAFVEALGDLFVEAIAAPGFAPDALERLQTKRKNCRLLHIADTPQPTLELRSIRGGILAQTRDIGDPADVEWRVVSQRKPTPEETDMMHYAWLAVQHVKSNGIVLAVQNATIGIGGGLPNRVDAVRIAVEKAGDKAQGAAMASDAFFPFADGIEAGINAGVTAVIQPGGSIRDKEVIAAADAAGVALVFTGVRHFRH